MRNLYGNKTGPSPNPYSKDVGVRPSPPKMRMDEEAIVDPAAIESYNTGLSPDAKRVLRERQQGYTPGTDYNLSRK